MSNGLTAASALGIDSHLIHGHGRDESEWPGLEFHNDVGLILFSCIATLLYIASHYWSSVRCKYLKYTLWSRVSLIPTF